MVLNGINWISIMCYGSRHTEPYNMLFDMLLGRVLRHCDELIGNISTIIFETDLCDRSIGLPTLPLTFVVMLRIGLEAPITKICFEDDGANVRSEEHTSELQS